MTEHVNKTDSNKIGFFIYDYEFSVIAHHFLSSSSMGSHHILDLNKYKG